MQNQPSENPLWANLPERIEALKEFGAIWARSGAIKADRVEQGISAAAFCMASGITPLEFMATYDLVDGVPRKKAMACLAEFKKRGGKFRWLSEPDDKEKAEAEFTFEEQTLKVKFTLDDARQQGLLKPGSNWTKAPSYMLRARVSSTGIGMLTPEIVAGAEAAPDEAPAQLPKLQLDAKSTEDQKAKEEKELADMGLAPAQPTPPTKPANPEPDQKLKAPEKTKPAKRQSISIPGPDETPDSGPGPMPPAKTIEPEAPTEPVAPAPGKTPGLEPEQDLNPEIIEQMGRIFQGNYLPVAQWMIREKWIPASEKELTTEVAAAAHLQRMLPRLGQARAKKVLTRKLAFMRSAQIQTIEP